MKNIFPGFQQIPVFRQLLRWTLLIVPVSAVTGLAVALFLWLLDRATSFRWNHLWLISLLPLAGIVIWILYARLGKKSAAGNNLVIDEIHQPGGGIPFRMAPLVLFSTVLTHLFGGSAGREGTAVQIGGSISYKLAGWFRLSDSDRSLLLKCGVAAGFGAVFGTPVTGAIFALEVLAIGKMQYDALLPCLMASLLADVVCASCGIHHTRYSVSFSGNGKPWTSWIAFDFILLAKVIVSAVAFGLVAYSFSALSHGLKKLTVKYIRRSWITPVIGAVLVLVISYLIGSWDYLGLGVTNPRGGVSILSSFSAGGATSWSWFWKLLLTVITLSTGFKGGEVTPLFFIGAALGNTLATLSGAPVDLFAALGFIAVFAGATNTPLACTMMGVELFGSHNVVYYAVASFTAYYFSGRSGIYTAQRQAVGKLV